MEALVRQLCLSQELLEAPRHVAGVVRRPFGRAEHQAPVPPPVAREQAFFELPDAMGTQGVHGYLRQRDRAAASLGFGLDELELAVDSLQGRPYGEAAAVQVDVIPAQPQCFALS